MFLGQDIRRNNVWLGRDFFFKLGFYIDHSKSKFHIYPKIWTDTLTPEILDNPLLLKTVNPDQLDSELLPFKSLAINAT